MHHLVIWLNELVVTWFGWVEHGRYFGISALMAMESSIFPVPSEVVIPPAAYWAAQGKMNFWGVIAAGTFGSWLGSAITYLVARSLGRLVVIKWGKYIFVTEDKLVRAEHWLHRYEAGGIFFARLLPVIRHLISIPAGFIRMDFKVFSLMTTVGSLLWCTVLAFYGKIVLAQYATEHPDWINNPGEMAKFIKGQSHYVVGGVLILCICYFAVMRLTSKKPQPAS
jgi:membrane protein DedA with SNARE-associated domain